MVTFLDELIDDSDDFISTESFYDYSMESDMDDDFEYDDFEEDDEYDDDTSRCKTAEEAYTEWAIARNYYIANENFVKTAVDVIVKKFQQLCDWFHKKIMGLSDNNPLKKVYIKFSKRAKADLEEAKRAKDHEAIQHLEEELDNLKSELKEELSKLGTNEKKFNEAIAQRNKKMNKFDKSLAKANKVAYNAKNSSDKIKNGYSKQNMNHRG